MKATLFVDKPANGHIHQATDKVQGRVDVQLDDNSEPPEVKVIFQGVAKVTLKPGFDAKAQIGDTHKRTNYKLFTLVQVLKPTTADDGTTLSAPFSFSFPQTGRCCRRLISSAANSTKSLVCPLPPSTLLSTPGVKVRVSYGVTAVCKRPGSGLYHRLLHRTVTSRQSINYAPPIFEQLLFCAPAIPTSNSPVSVIPDPTQQLLRSTAWLPASKLGIEDSTDAGTPPAKAHTLLPGCLPPYSPAMTLGVVMPNPPVITPGQPVELGLFLRTPRSLLDSVADTGNGLQLCSLSVRLRRQTQARIGTAMRVDETTWPVWSVQGSVPIRNERVDIACGLPSERSSSGSERTSEDSDASDRSEPSKMTTGGVHLPAAAVAAIQGQPGFGTCFASRVYSLEVAMGVAVVPIPTHLSSASTASSTSSSSSSAMSVMTMGNKKKVATPDIQYTRTAIRVIVSEPPPDYEITSD